MSKIPIKSALTSINIEIDPDKIPEFSDYPDFFIPLCNDCEKLFVHQSISQDPCIPDPKKPRTEILKEMW